MASSNSAAATVPEPSWRTKGGVGGKGKGKSNAKGKGKAAGAADANVTLNEDDDGEENAFDEGESDPAGRGSSPPSTIASSANGGGARVGGIGHAMLKSRLTKVSLRGMTKVDDNAVMVSRMSLFAVRILHLARLYTSMRRDWGQNIISTTLVVNASMLSTPLLLAALVHLVHCTRLRGLGGDTLAHAACDRKRVRYQYDLK